MFAFGNVMSAARTCASMNLVGLSLPLASLFTDPAGEGRGKTAMKYYSRGGRSNGRRSATFSTGYEVCYSCLSFLFGIRVSVCSRRKATADRALGKRRCFDRPQCGGDEKPTFGYLHKGFRNRKSFECPSSRAAGFFGGYP